MNFRDSGEFRVPVNYGRFPYTPKISLWGVHSLVRTYLLYNYILFDAISYIPYISYHSIFHIILFTCTAKSILMMLFYLHSETDRNS